MAVRDILTVMADQIRWLRDPDEQKAYMAGMLTGVRVAKVLVLQRIAGKFGPSLYGFASRTYMGPLRQGGMSVVEFIQGANIGTDGVVSLTEEMFSCPEMMQDRRLSQIFQRGFENGVDVIYIDGCKHFLEGYAYPSRQEAEEKVKEWMSDMEVVVTAKMASLQ